MKTRIAIAMLALVSLAACSTHQDPLQGQSDRVRHAEPAPDTPPPAGKPVPTNNMVIDVPDSVGFTEGVASSFQIGVRSLLPEYDETTLAITNLNDFPGATFDDATGKFSWTPPAGITGGTTERKMEVHISGYISSSVDERLGTLTKDRVLEVAVVKVPKVPYVWQVSNLPDSLREDDDEMFYVLVKDLDGGMVQPALNFTNPTGYMQSLASFITVTEGIYDKGTQLWTFKCHISLRTELTGSSNLAGFQVGVLSTFGKASPPVQQTLMVYTTLMPPQSTWSGQKTVTPGVETRVPFVIYNPKGEGQLTITAKTVPDGAQLVCSNTTPGASISCLLIYKPAIETPDVHVEKLALTVQTVNSDHHDTNKLSTDMQFSLLVEAP